MVEDRAGEKNIYAGNIINDSGCAEHILALKVCTSKANPISFGFGAVSSTATWESQTVQRFLRVLKT